jgi:MFS family permease
MSGVSGHTISTRRVYIAKLARTLAYSFMALLLPLYLSSKGLTPLEIGVVLACVGVGNLLMLTLAPTLVNTLGLRRTMILLPLTLVLGSLLLLYGKGLAAYIVGGLLGSLSVTQTESGVLLVIDQTLLAEVEENKRTSTFSYYNLVGYVGSALGGLTLSIVSKTLPISLGDTLLLAGYAAVGALVSLLYATLKTPRLSAPNRQMNVHEVARSSPTLLGLAALFSVDAFAGGFVVQSWLSYWFHYQLGVGRTPLGVLFFLANTVSALSLIIAPKLAARIGLVRVMVYTHLPSNILLATIPLAPTPIIASALLLLRQSLSQMDVPTRQALVVAISPSQSRVGAISLTTLTRSVAQILGTPITGVILQLGPAYLPFFAAGSIKSAYDVAVYWLMRKNLEIGKNKS